MTEPDDLDDPDDDQLQLVHFNNLGWLEENLCRSIYIYIYTEMLKESLRWPAF